MVRKAVLKLGLPPGPATNSGLRRARGPPRRCTRVSRRPRGALPVARESVEPGASRSPASPSRWVRGGRSPAAPPLRPARHASGPPPSPRLPVIRSRLRRVPGRKQRRGAGSARRRRRRRHGPPFIRSPRRQRRRPGPVRRGRAWAAGAAGARPAGSASRRRASSGRGRPIPP